MARSREIVAEFTGEHRVFLNDGGATRVVIGNVVDTDGNRRTIKGEAAERQLKPGLTYQFWGYTTHHPNFGEQFVFSSFCLLEPKGKHATRTYVEQCDGIGPAKSAKLWELYGDNAIQMLREQPAECATAVPGLTSEKAEAASARLQEWQRFEAAKVGVLSLLHGRGMPKKLVDLVISRYGLHAHEVIKRNPYLLMRFSGVGFLKADKLYIELGLNPAALKRQALCAWSAIARDSSGDTWFPRRQAEQAIREKVGGAALNIERAMSLCLRAKLLAERTDCMGNRYVAEYGKARSEIRVAMFVEDAIREVTAEDGVGWPDVDTLEISDHQREQVSRAMAGRIGILAGRPGTGKTYTVAKIIKAIAANIGLESIAVCAPTGKAAVRASEALANAGVSIKATTIHSLLKVMDAEDGGWKFQHNEHNPLPFSFVFVDESSMIDTGLMSSLLAARGTGTSIMFIGDTAQLAPVGHGAPLRDMIAAGVPCGELTEIRRNSGRIVSACKEMVERRRFTVSPALNLEIGENLAVVHKETPADQIDVLIRCVERFKQSEEQRIDPVWGVQVVVAVNAKSELSRKTLNRRLQDLLNPATEHNSIDRVPFRVGDKIICTKNSRFPNAMPLHLRERSEGDGGEDAEKVYVANGEQAEVLEVKPNRITARLTAPDREIIIPRGTGKDADDDASGGNGANANTSTADDGAAEEEDAGTGCSWDLAYAISCHRSQGSEWPVVIVMLDKAGGAQRVCTRNWLYTAISRAKSFCLLIGEKSTADAMLTRDGIGKRRTFLKELLVDAIAGTKRAAELTDASDVEEVDWLDEVIDELVGAGAGIDEFAVTGL